VLPNKLYKWNGQKWIEVAKSTTDRYAYEEEYIKYITQKIVSGEYDINDLSKAEQEEVLLRLDHHQKSKL
jgi:3-methyladenine DNA glycosylase/8-oxoguanine DNA glycosylase